MNFYDQPETLLEGRPDSALTNLRESKRKSIFDRTQHWLFIGKPLTTALMVVLLDFSAEVFAQNIKLGYAALSGTQVAAWMAKEGGYLTKYGIDAELIYIPVVAATQALIAGEIQLAQVTGVSTSGAILAGADVRIIASSLNRLVGFIHARP